MCAASETVAASQAIEEGKLPADRRTQRLARYERLHRLYGRGLPTQEIAPALGLGAVAACRWLNASGSPMHDKPAQPRPPDPYLPHPEARWNEGCRNGWRLWQKVRALGFAGAGNAVAHWAAGQRWENPPLRAAEVRRAAPWP